MRDLVAAHQNYILASALVGWFVAQILKIFTGIFHERKFNIIELFVSTGGMPSSHSAAVSALCTASFVEYGVSSFQFAFTFVLAMIVMRDAAGIRKEVGKQAKVINRMWENICAGSFEEIDLKELVGHTPLQVFIGALVGIVIALCMGLIF